ncbi:MAG: phosphoribosylaminoimidazolesuccinocarboxamide synthase [Gammaproteobacteria bacterium]
MEKQKHLYSGKAKSLYSTNDSNYVIMHFRDDATAFNGEKAGKLTNKGKVNNYFNAFIMQTLTQAGIPTHFEKVLNERESLVKSLKMLPVECVVRNIAAGNLARRLGVTEGLELTPPVFEFYYKSDALNDPMINEYHIRTFKWATEQEVETMKALSFKINDILKPLFLEANLLLVDYKLEFGRLDNRLVLGDEFTPDGSRIWDATSKEKLDKDRFRRDLGHVVESYIIAAERLGIEV